jgi:hypothetical protein
VSKATCLLLDSQLVCSNVRYQTKLFEMQREGKVAPQVLQQLANERLLEAYVTEQ